MQTLESTVLRIDNILLSVEQTTGNFYFGLLPHFSSRETVHTYCRELVESNPLITGCAMAFSPGYFEAGENYMAYFHRDDRGGIVESETFAGAPYTEQAWFTRPMNTFKPGWMLPLDNDVPASEPLITFTLPIYGPERKPVGVVGVDVSLELLSEIVDAAKPSPNSYCMLLSADGSFIVHLDSRRLAQDSRARASALADPSPSVRQAAEAMLSGEADYRRFRMNGQGYYVFYKPFQRVREYEQWNEELGWSVGIVYPENDIFGDYNRLLYYVLAIAATGLLLLFALCRYIFRRQLKPLLMLTESAQHIAQGNYSDTIPRSTQNDEIGHLQDNFGQMQQSLSSRIGELEQLTATLEERGAGLRAAYTRARKADGMKTAFLHNMTDQMLAPAEAIDRDVADLAGGNADTRGAADNIRRSGTTITRLLDHLINISDEEPEEGGDQ